MSPHEAEVAMAGHFASVLYEFSPEEWVRDMTGPLADNISLAFAQIESTVYLRNQLLRDSDWAGMDHSVELRTPLVDAKLLRDFEPLLHLFPKFHGKSLLSNVPIERLPIDILARKKTGFDIPVLKWSNSLANRQNKKLARHCWMDVVAKQFVC
jgi:asparagine synthase (glutamine-hydrolysing)